MQQNKKNDTKAYVISFIAMGAVVVLYSLIFPMYRWQHYLIVAGIALLVGRVVFIMAQGLDTSKEAPVQQPIPKTGDNAVDSLVEKGQEMLAQIRHENDLIPDAQLTDQMNQLDKVSNQIFHTVAEHPEKAPQIRRFMDYYLPTTLKMLTGYRRMDERQVKGQNANETRGHGHGAQSLRQAAGRPLSGRNAGHLHRHRRDGNHAPAGRADRRRSENADQITCNTLWSE